MDHAWSIPLPTSLLPPSAVFLWFVQLDVKLAAQLLLAQVASVGSHSQEVTVSSATKAVSPAQPPIPNNVFLACPVKTFSLVFVFPALTLTAPAVKATTSFAQNASQDTLLMPMELVVPVLPTVSPATPLEPDIAMSVDAVKVSPESDSTPAVSVFWDALPVFQPTSAPAWPAPPELTLPVPVSARFVQLAVPLVLEQAHALAVCQVTNFREAAASRVAPSLAPPAILT